MSKEGVQQAVQAIAKEMVSLAHIIMEDDRIGTNPKTRRNTLANSALYHDVNSVVKSQIGNDAVIDTLFNNYVEFLEWDRPKKYGKRPPIDVLKDWASGKGIPTDSNTLWAISTAIWRDGHTGRPIFATFDKEIDSYFLDEWSEKLFEALTDNLDQLFND